MGHFVEFIMELLFGLVKDTPVQMPKIDYIDSFVVKHPRKKTVARICATMILIVIFSFLWFLVKHETRILFAVFVGLGVILFALPVYAFSFKCCVNDVQISLSYLGFFKKMLKWQEVLCVKIVEQTNEKTVIIALYNKQGKCILDMTTDMENSWYIVKMAEHKEISIKHEKNLSIKQLSHL